MWTTTNSPTLSPSSQQDTQSQGRNSGQNRPDVPTESKRISQKGLSVTREQTLSIQDAERNEEESGQPASRSKLRTHLRRKEKPVTAAVPQEQPEGLPTGVSEIPQKGWNRKLHKTSQEEGEEAKTTIGTDGSEASWGGPSRRRERQDSRPPERKQGVDREPSPLPEQMVQIYSRVTNPNGRRCPLHGQTRGPPEDEGDQPAKNGQGAPPTKGCGARLL